MAFRFNNRNRPRTSPAHQSAPLCQRHTLKQSETRVYPGLTPGETVKRPPRTPTSRLYVRTYWPKAAILEERGYHPVIHNYKLIDLVIFVTEPVKKLRGHTMKEPQLLKALMLNAGMPDDSDRKTRKGYKVLPIWKSKRPTPTRSRRAPRRPAQLAYRAATSKGSHWSSGYPGSDRACGRHLDAWENQL